MTVGQRHVYDCGVTGQHVTSLANRANYHELLFLAAMSRVNVALQSRQMP